MAKVVPGMMLQITGEFMLGEGLYSRDGCVYASRVGTVCSRESADGKRLVYVQGTGNASAILPSIGHTVIGTVNRITSKFVGVDVVVVEMVPPQRPLYFDDPFKATIRIQDILPAQEEQPTQLYLSFRPGDLVRARIIGIGDASAGFLLSTSIEDTLGVVYARSAASGEPMVPVSWNEMICPRTGIKEHRKAAKPRPPTP